MLRSIRAVTVCAADLAGIELAYAQYLQYKTIARGSISFNLAAFWRAPKMAGREFLLMQPMSGELVFLRFVQSEPPSGYAPMMSTGWNATEVLVKDPDALAVKLAGSSFKIIGQPRGLSSNPAIRAMQVIGPANELLYLTSIPEGEPTFNLGSARTEVDRVFIAVAGGKNLHAMRAFYLERLKTPVTDPMGVRVSALSRAYGLDTEHAHNLALVQMPERFLVELDEYPAAAVERIRLEGELPAGMAIVSFNVESLGDFEKESIELTELPYQGHRAALITGAAGEWIELIESA